MSVSRYDEELRFFREELLKLRSDHDALRSDYTALRSKHSVLRSDHSALVRKTTRENLATVEAMGRFRDTITDAVSTLYDHFASRFSAQGGSSERCNQGQTPRGRHDQDDDPDSQREHRSTEANIDQARVQGESNQVTTSGPGFTRRPGKEHVREDEEIEQAEQMLVDMVEQSECASPLEEGEWVAPKSDSAVLGANGETLFNTADLSDEEQEVEPPRNPNWPNWFRTITTKKNIVYRKLIQGTSGSEANSKIMSWFFDKVLWVYVIKRYDGNQYLDVSRDSFNSIPLIELKDLAKLELINPQNDGTGGHMATWLRTDVLTEKYEWIKPNNVGKYVEYKGTLNPITNRPYGRMVYKPMKTLTYIPCKKIQQDILGDLEEWWIDEWTGEMCFQDSRNDIILKLYDPVHVTNMSRNDLLMCAKRNPLSLDIWRREADEYVRVVQFCLKYKIWAGSKNTKILEDFRENNPNP